MEWIGVKITILKGSRLPAGLNKKKYFQHSLPLQCLGSIRNIARHTEREEVRQLLMPLNRSDGLEEGTFELDTQNSFNNFQVI